MFSHYSRSELGADDYKEKGNVHYKNKEYRDAMNCYSQAIGKFMIFLKCSFLRKYIIVKERASLSIFF